MVLAAQAPVGWLRTASTALARVAGGPASTARERLLDEDAATRREELLTLARGRLADPSLEPPRLQRPSCAWRRRSRARCGPGQRPR